MSNRTRIRAAALQREVSGLAQPAGLVSQSEKDKKEAAYAVRVSELVPLFDAPNNFAAIAKRFATKVPFKYEARELRQVSRGLEPLAQKFLRHFVSEHKAKHQLNIKNLDPLYNRLCTAIKENLGWDYLVATIVECYEDHDPDQTIAYKQACAAAGVTPTYSASAWKKFLVKYSPPDDPTAVNFRISKIILLSSFLNLHPGNPVLRAVYNKNLASIVEVYEEVDPAY